MSAQYYESRREPFVAADVPAVTLAATDKALYPLEAFPILGSHYFARVGKKIRVRAFGKITTGATPGNLTVDVYFGNGGDANGTLLQSSAAQTLIANQTDISWHIDFVVHCRTVGAAGRLFCMGEAYFGTAVIAVGDFLIPAAAAVQSAALDLTGSNIISLQAKRSGSTVESMTVQELDVILPN